MSFGIYKADVQTYNLKYLPDGPTKKYCKRNVDKKEVKCCGKQDKDDCFKPPKCCNEKKHFKFHVLPEPPSYPDIAASCGYNCCACIKICTSLVLDELISCLTCRQFSNTCKDKLCDLVDVALCCTRDCCVCLEKVFVPETNKQRKKREKRQKAEIKAEEKKAMKRDKERRKSEKKC